MIRLILQLEKVACVISCHLQIPFPQYDSTQYLYSQPYRNIFPLMETLGFQFLLKAETHKILVVFYPSFRDKIAMLETNV